MEYIVPIALGAIIIALAYIAWRFSTDARELNARCLKLTQEHERALADARALRARYSGIIDLEAELTAGRNKLEGTRRELKDFETESERRRVKLSEEYQQAMATYGELKKEISLLEENLEDISFGLYKPHFSFQTSDEYKTALENLREKERQLIREGGAAACAKKWTVGNSEREGARMVKLNEKLLLRAFNGECEAAVADVSWNNVTKMEERVRKSFEAVNKLGEVLSVSVTQQFLALKLDEVRLTHEYEEKRHQEREEQRRIRAQIREEERAQQEINRAREEAELEEARFQKALERAREEAAKATGGQLQKLTEQISSFEAKLDEARSKKERAISRAQLTKSGFVYVISNLGSFGDGIFKVGMTRRMEPMERVDELGDASVPFPFDVHAMLYSDNAPELEAALHQLLEDRQLNLVNPRKEFFRDVVIEEVEAFVKSRGLSAQFMRQPEAREYRETLAKLEQQTSGDVPKQAERFSNKLFNAPAGDS